MCLRVTYIEQQASSSLQASDGGRRRRASCSRTIRSMMYRCMVNCMMGHHDVYVSRVCMCLLDVGHDCLYVRMMAGLMMTDNQSDIVVLIGQSSTMIWVCVCVCVCVCMCMCFSPLHVRLLC